MLRAFFAILLMCRLGGCSVFHVLPGGMIQDAVSAAVDGDTVLIHDGTYHETVLMYGKNITIGSLYLLDNDTLHISNTVIEPDTLRPDTNSCFVYAYFVQISSRLVGLTLRNGRGTWWSESREKAGGCVFVWRSSATIERCRFENGNAYNGGGLCVTGGGFHRLVQVRECIFQDCQAIYGGGMYATLCSLSVYASNFVHDSAFFGGGLSTAGERDWMTIENSQFLSCIAEDVAGLLYAGCEGYIRGCLFDGNDNNFAGLAVSHLDIEQSGGYISGNVFTNTTTKTAIGLDGMHYPLHFVGNIIEENLHDDETGGTIYVFQETVGEIAYNVIRNNINGRGGVFYAMDRARPRIHHNWIESNITLHSDQPSVLVSIDDARPTLDSNVIMHNNGWTIDFSASSPVTIHAENNWWGDPSGPYHPRLNPNGRGDTLVSDSVLFIPWLTAPPDTHMPESAVRFERPEILVTWKLIEVYPNPFNSSLRIILAGFARNDFRITLHNLLGQEVAEIHRGPLAGGELIYQAPPSLATGVYFVRASGSNNVETKKVVFLK